MFITEGPNRRFHRSPWKLQEAVSPTQIASQNFLFSSHVPLSTLMIPSFFSEGIPLQLSKGTGNVFKAPGCRNFLFRTSIFLHSPKNDVLISRAAEPLKISPQLHPPTMAWCCLLCFNNGMVLPFVFLDLFSFAK